MLFCSDIDRIGQSQVDLSARIGISHERLRDDTIRLLDQDRRRRKWLLGSICQPQLVRDLDCVIGTFAVDPDILAAIVLLHLIWWRSRQIDLVEIAIFQIVLLHWHDQPLAFFASHMIEVKDIEVLILRALEARRIVTDGGARHDR